MPPKLSAAYIEWLLLSFEGRLPRLPFWLASLAIILVVYWGEQWFTLFLGERYSAFVNLAFLWFSSALVVKRLNDRDLPQAWLFICLAPDVLVGFFVVSELLVRDTEPETLVWLGLVAAMIVTLAMIVELGIKRGSIGTNRHGPDPI